MDRSVYRSVPTEGPSCSKHPSAPSRGVCTGCGEHVCTPCSLYVDLQIVCPRCAKRAWRRRVLRSTGARAAVVAGMLGLGVTGAAVRARHHGDPVNWGAYTEKVHAAQTVLRARPCDVRAIGELVSALEGAGDPFTAKADLRTAEVVCKLPTAMLEHLLTLETDTRDFAAGIDTATALLAASPTARVYTRRADFLLTSGEPMRAARDYHRALTLNHDDERAFASLVGICESIGAHQAVRALLDWRSEGCGAEAAACDPPPLDVLNRS